MKIALLLALAATAQAACLSNEVLTALGFTPVTAYTPTSSENVCGNALNGAKSCVNLTDFKNKVTASKANIQKDQETKMAGFGGQFNSISQRVNNICTKALDRGVGKKLGNKDITQDLIDTCNQIKTNSANQTNQGTRLSTAATRNKCFKVVNQYINAAHCLIISDKATDYVTVDANGVLNFNVNQSTADTVFNACVESIAATCTLNQMANVVATMTGKNIERVRVKAACSNLTNIESCVNNLTTCSADLKKNILESLFTPIGTGIGDSANSDLSTDSTTADASATRLLAAVNSAAFTVTTGGYDAANTSTNLSTDVTTTTTTGGTTTSTKIAAVLVALFAVAF